MSKHYRVLSPSYLGTRLESILVVESVCFGEYVCRYLGQRRTFTLTQDEFRKLKLEEARW